MTKRKVHSDFKGNNKRHNAGHRRAPNNNHQRSNDGFKGGKNNPGQNSFLPQPSILQEYEYATEGAANRILEMAEIEQDRRNKWEDEYRSFYKKSLRIGQLFGFFLLVSVVVACVLLSESGHDRVAEVLAASSFLSVAIASIFSGRFNKPSHQRPRRHR